MARYRTSLPLQYRALVVAALALASTALVSTALVTGPVTVRHTGDRVSKTPWRDYAGAQIAAYERAEDGADRAALPVGDVSAAKPEGHDVASYQKSVNWTQARSKGADFVYVKATESTGYKNPYFKQQYDGARTQGILHGAYHFALPDQASGDKQAQHFVANGGAWQSDGWTLPPALDLEYNPYGAVCYGLSKVKMRSWIAAFSGEVNRLTGRYPTIYTPTNWWKKCTGNTTAFANTNPLWIPRYSSSPGELPGGWRAWTFWQYGNSGALPGDQNIFNGALARLKKLAKG